MSSFRKGREDNKLRPEDRPVHDWYRFVLSFPPHLVRAYLQRFELIPGQMVLDPFCGTGTTLVECKKLGISSIGIEPNPMAWFASKVKLDWRPDPDGLLSHANDVAKLTRERLSKEGIADDVELPLFTKKRKIETRLLSLAPEAERILLKDSISPLPLHKTLVLLTTLQDLTDDRYLAHERLSMAKALVTGISNLHFGPEVGVGPAKADAPAVSIWLQQMGNMAADLRGLSGAARIESVVHRADSRNLVRFLDDESVDVVITSPPYPNEKDYTRTTRLESILLGFIRDRQELRGLKQDLIRSNTRNVYKTDNDDELVLHHPEIQRLARTIERRRIELRKTSGFERLYGRLTKLYFGGMARHLADLRAKLRPNARLAYVVGDQASYLQVMIRTGRLIADIASSLGYEVVGIDLYRTRLATATREQLREEVVVLRWPGPRAVGGSKLMSRSEMYEKIVERLFQSKYRRGTRAVPFKREDISKIAKQLKIEPPANLGDLVYSFRYRRSLPKSIRETAAEGEEWIIRPAGRAKYKFELIAEKPIVPNDRMTATKVPDSTPGVVAKYALTDEQALLARVRYNRLVDIFTGVACYSLQNHLRTAVPNIGQVETDELYVGVDKKGVHYVFPVQAKGGRDKLSIVQIEQDMALCDNKFPTLVCRSIAAQFMKEDVIAMFEFERDEQGEVGIASEKHYKLVPPDDISDADLEAYRSRISAD